MSLREDLDGWMDLVAHPKWKELCEIAEDQRAPRQANILNGLSDLREEDKQRGEWLGIGLIIATPTTIIEELQSELDNLNKE